MRIHWIIDYAGVWRRSALSDHFEFYLYFYCLVVTDFLRTEPVMMMMNVDDDGPLANVNGDNVLTPVCR